MNQALSTGQNLLAETLTPDLRVNLSLTGMVAAEAHVGLIRVNASAVTV